jgi:hypothetical protein
MSVATEAVVKRVNYIWEMSQNDEYLNRRGVSKRSCGCTSMFHFDNVSISSTVLTIQRLKGNPFNRHVIFIFIICLHLVGIDRHMGRKLTDL